MLLVKLIRFVLGSVRVCARGHFCERLLNLLNLNRVTLWDVRRLPDGVQFELYRRDAKLARELARRAGVALEEQGRAGLPELLRRYRKRYAFLPCLLLFFGLLWYLSGFIWAIEVSGNREVTEAEVLALLEENGVTVGVRKRGLELRPIYNRILLADGRISWIAVNFDGTLALVELRERVPQPEILDAATPTNVVAARAGQIVSVEALAGEPVVTAGTAVEPGELLISGVVTALEEAPTRVVAARGRVLARVWDTLTETAPLRETHSQYTGETKRRHALEFGKTRINFYFDSGIPYAEYDTITRREQVRLFGSFYLPAALVTEEARELTTFSVAVDAAHAEAEARQALDALVAQNYDPASLERIGVTVTETADGVTVAYEVEALVDIAVRERIEVTEVQT